MEFNGTERSIVNHKMETHTQLDLMLHVSQKFCGTERSIVKNNTSL